MDSRDRKRYVPPVVLEELRKNLMVRGVVEGKKEGLLDSLLIELSRDQERTIGHVLSCSWRLF